MHKPEFLAPVDAALMIAGMLETRGMAPDIAREAANNVAQALVGLTIGTAPVPCCSRPTGHVGRCLPLLSVREDLP